MTLKIEVGKFYRTRDGGKAVCIADRGCEEIYPYVMAYFGGDDETNSVTYEGLSYINELDKKDIVSEWIEPEVFYGNIYPSKGTIVLRSTRDEADSSKTHNRIARVRIEFYPGQFDD